MIMRSQSTPDLHIFTIDMENRDFVLKPMDEIAPLLQTSCIKQDHSSASNELLAKR